MTRSISARIFPDTGFAGQIWTTFWLTLLSPLWVFWIHSRRAAGDADPVPKDREITLHSAQIACNLQ